MTTRIKPTRTMTSYHLRASDSPSGFAMTLMVLTRLEKQTMTLNSHFLCLLLNEVSHALQIVFSNSICPETCRSTATNLAAATVTVTVAATTTNLAAATTTAVAKATTTALAHTNVTTTLFQLVIASPPRLHCGTMVASQNQKRVVVN